MIYLNWKNLHLFWTFNRRLIIPSVVITIVASFFLKKPTDEINIQVNFSQLGLAYLFVSLIMHLVVYELRNPNENYFYYNLGLGKRLLWLLNLIVGLIVLLCLLCYKYFYKRTPCRYHHQGVWRAYGFQKKAQKTPNSEIEKAIKIKEAYYADK